MKKNISINVTNSLSLIENKEAFLLTLLQLKKDLGLSDDDFNPWLNCTNGTEILIFLNAFFAQNQNQKGSNLQQIFYRLDIPEKKIRESKNLSMDEQVKFISLMTLERAFQKVYLRKYFSEKGNKKK